MQVAAKLAMLNAKTNSTNQAPRKAIMPRIDELTRTRKLHATPAKGAGRQIIEGDYQRNDVDACAVVGLSQEPSTLSPDEVDEQIRRFFEQRLP
jgi:hypothetical protein